MGWGGQILQEGKTKTETRGYWDTQERSLPITAKETLALLYTLQNLAGNLHITRIDVFVDSKVLVATWEKQVSKSPVILLAMKSLFKFCAARNLGLSFRAVTGKPRRRPLKSFIVSGRHVI